MKRTIEMCTRIEGHGQVSYHILNDQIMSVRFELNAFRGFENFLINKKIEDVPKIVSRICGMCHVAQTFASYKAIEDMFNIEPSKNIVYLRQLLMIGDHIKSHIVHIFFQAFPDLLYILLNKKNYSTPNEILKFDPEISSNAFELINNSTKIVSILGGRTVHPITPAIGGFHYFPTNKDLENVKKYFQRSYNNLKVITEKFIDLFYKTSPPDDFSFGKPVFMGLNNNTFYDIYEGDIRLNDHADILTYFKPSDYNKYLIRDELSEITLKFNIERNLLVGPIGRYNVVENYGDNIVDDYLDYFNITWKSSILFWTFLGLLELIILTDKAVNILENHSFSSRLDNSFANMYNKGEGIGVLEAPRGILIHNYQVDENNRLKSAKIFIPTSMNIPTMNELLTNYCKKKYELTRDLDEIKRNSQIIIRSFDPCTSCATHLIIKR